ncbi:MAG: ABC transporter ATP-binding protein [Gammaproteobacteria bacterium]|nr:ABC transporter ATP-binding protein [Gammaproteobacteria bacterium]
MSTPPLLTLKDIHTHIGKYHILHGVNLCIPANSCTVLLGRNGVGKTTTLRTIMGLWTASSGSTTYKNIDITLWDTPKIAGLNIAYIPENMGIFFDLTVKENLFLAARQAKTVSAMIQSRLDWIFSIFPDLHRFFNYTAGHLSGGQKQMLAVARAFVEPRELLIIDEPSKGFSPAIIDQLIQALNELKKNKVTLLLVEQNLLFANSLGDTVAIMEDGRIVYSGQMTDLWQNKEIQTHYLGLHL